MPGLDGTGPLGLGRMTGGRRGWCADAGATAGRRLARKRRSLRTGTVPEKFDRIEDALAEVLERLERLESERG
jgi:hypothetical protein